MNVQLDVVMEQNTGPEPASQIVKMELFNIKIVIWVVVQVMKPEYVSYSNN